MCNNLIKDKTAPNSKQITLNVLETLVENEKFLIFMAKAPNGGECPNCPTGRLSYDRTGSRGEEYWSCVKCGFVVKA